MLSLAKESNCAVKQGQLFLVSAPSGAGKTTIVNRVIESLKGQVAIERIITYTSRYARSNEIDGVDYFFISPQEFEGKIKDGFFIEWSSVYGAYYGSPENILDRLRQGVSLIAILDQAGVESVLMKHEAITLWLKPPALCDLQQRLEHRATEAQCDLAFRLELAVKELANKEVLDRFDYHIANSVLEDAILEVRNIIIKELNIDKLS